MKRLIICLLISSLLLTTTACSNESTDANDINTEQSDDGTVKVEIESIDTSEVIKETVTNTNRKAIRIAVVGSPASDILKAADQILQSTEYGIEIVNYEDYKTPNEMVKNGEVFACLCDNQVLLDSYNMIDESDLVIAEKLYYDPLAIFPGKITDMNFISSGETIAVSEGDVNVARALYLLEQKGLLTVKEGALYQATMEDVISNPFNISIEEVDINGGWPDTSKYGLIISDYNRAVLVGIDPQTALGEENRNSNIIDLFAVGLVVNSADLDDAKTKIILNALNDEEVEEYIDSSFYQSVSDYK